MSEKFFIAILVKTMSMGLHDGRGVPKCINHSEMAILLSSFEKQFSPRAPLTTHIQM